MRRARAARSVDTRQWTQWRILANSVGMLFLRSIERGERVHRAMVCRGWSGEWRWLDEASPTQSRQSGSESAWPSSKSTD
jgi:cobalt/nickel transport system permease protein